MGSPIKLTKAEIKRYKTKVAVAGKNDCWEWLGACDKDGYGLFSVTATKQYKAHRVACYLKYGTAGKMTCHTCNNPACCNPAHLYPGTGKQNSRDRDKNGCPWRGEKQHLSKLTNLQVKQMVKLFECGLTNRQIADKLQCAIRLVYRVRNGEAWSWLTGFKKKVY
jgi:hypothetical protein